MQLSESKNKSNCLKAVKAKTNKKDPIEIWTNENGFDSIKVYESDFIMDNADQPLRFVKYAMKYPDKKRSQIIIATTNMDMSLKTIYKMIKARIDVENVFNNLKNERNLEHCYVHGGKAVEAILYLIFIANNLVQLFLTR